MRLWVGDGRGAWPCREVSGSARADGNMPGCSGVRSHPRPDTSIRLTSHWTSREWPVRHHAISRPGLWPILQDPLRRRSLASGRRAAVVRATLSVIAGPVGGHRRHGGGLRETRSVAGHASVADAMTFTLPMMIAVGHRGRRDPRDGIDGGGAARQSIVPPLCQVASARRLHPRAHHAVGEVPVRYHLTFLVSVIPLRFAGGKGSGSALRRYFTRLDRPKLSASDPNASVGTASARSCTPALHPTRAASTTLTLSRMRRADGSTSRRRTPVRGSRESFLTSMSR